MSQIVTACSEVYGLGNPYFDAAAIALIAALFTVVRNWAVQDRSFHARFLFVGSDLIVGLIGIGFLLLCRLVYVSVTAAPQTSFHLLVWASAAILVGVAPTFVVTCLTERIAHANGPNVSGINLLVNFAFGAVPLSAAVYYLTTTIMGT